MICFRFKLNIATSTVARAQNSSPRLLLNRLRIFGGRALPPKSSFWKSSHGYHVRLHVAPRDFARSKPGRPVGVFHPNREPKAEHTPNSGRGNPHRESTQSWTWILQRPQHLSPAQHRSPGLPDAAADEFAGHTDQPTVRLVAGPLAATKSSTVSVNRG